MKPCFLLLASLVARSWAASVSGCVVPDASSSNGVAFVAASPPAPACAGALAWGNYERATINTTGWAVLDVHTSPTEKNDTLSGFAVGFLEGYLTYQEMADYALSTGATDPNSKKLQKFLDENWAWMLEQIAANPTAIYWRHLDSLLAQVRGAAAGQAAAGGSLTWADVYNAIIQGG